MCGCMGIGRGGVESARKVTSGGSGEGLAEGLGEMGEGKREMYR